MLDYMSAQTIGILVELSSYLLVSLVCLWTIARANRHKGKKVWRKKS